MVEYDYSSMGKKGSAKRWEKEHAKIRISNKISREKVAINAYLCGDGSISVRKSLKGDIHHEIRFFMDSLDLANRIVDLFRKEFNIKPKIRKVLSRGHKEGGYFNVGISNKPSCLHLLSLGKYRSLNWTMIKGLDNSLTLEWIKCFFDCEAHVNKYNNQIQVKSVNYKGINRIKKELEKFKIISKLYGPYEQKGIKGNDYWMLTIYDKESLKEYQKIINFYHPAKKLSLDKITAGVEQW